MKIVQLHISFTITKFERRQIRIHKTTRSVLYFEYSPCVLFLVEDCSVTKILSLILIQNFLIESFKIRLAT